MPLLRRNTRIKLNRIAWKFYKSMGYDVPANYDFSRATHPAELGMWNMALLAYDEILGTKHFYDHFVNPEKVKK